MTAKTLGLFALLTVSALLFSKSWNDSQVDLLTHKSKPEGLVEQMTLRFERGEEVAESTRLSEAGESLQSVPPIFQILSILSIPKYALLDVRVDMKKGKIVRNQEIPITTQELFKDPNGFIAKQVTKNRTMTNYINLKPFSIHWAKRENLSQKKAEIPKEYGAFFNEEMATIPTAFEIKPGITIHLALYIHLNAPRDEVRISYIKFFYYKGNTLTSVSNYIQPTNEYPEFPTNFPILLNGYSPNTGLVFGALVQDLDGNGTKELIVGAGGRPHNRNLRYYNIYKFDKLVERIENERVKEK